MTFKELTTQFPALTATWNNAHAQKTDDTADVELWHTPVLCQSIPFAHCIKEIVYGDGKAKLLINYTSWTREKYAALKDSDDFMGELARGLTKYYPDLDYVLMSGWVELAPNTEAMDKFAEIYERVMTNPELHETPAKRKPIIKEVDNEEENDRDE